MANWTHDALLKLDRKYAEAGVHLHQRPFRAATELLGSAFALGSGGNPEVKQIMDAYAALVPEVHDSWPGAGVGIAVSVDRVRTLTLAVVFGGLSLEAWQATGFKSREEWWEWCRRQPDISSNRFVSSTRINRKISRWASVTPEWGAISAWMASIELSQNCANSDTGGTAWNQAGGAFGAAA